MQAKRKVIKKDPLMNCLRGMTAYGRGATQSALGRFEVQIQGTNRRYLEITLANPKYFSSFEGEIRKLIEGKVARGQVNVQLHFSPVENQKLAITPNMALVKGIKGAYEKIAKEIKVPFEFRVEYLLGEEGVLFQEESEKEKQESLSQLKKAVEKALVSFCEMKELEGRTAAHDFIKRLSFLKKKMAVIEEIALGAVPKLREKLKSRLSPFFDKKDEEERLIKEIVIYADRADISEEILRFNSLILEFQKTVEKSLADETETKGKRLDFLIQELFREINTIGSKAQEMKITSLVVDVKCELEKMREVIQNIE